MDLDHRYVAFLLRWHGLWRRRRGIDGLRRTVAQLQGLDLPVSELEDSILRARVVDYSSQQLDELFASGEVLWQGTRPTGERDGMLRLLVSRDLPSLGRITVFVPGPRERRIREILVEQGGLEFDQLTSMLGGFPDDILRTLWKLAWNGEVTSNSLDALRARRSAAAARYRPRPRPRYATRRRLPPGAVGRWTLLSGPDSGFAPDGERKLALARQLLDRLGFVCPATIAGEAVTFGALAPLLEQLEGAGLAHRTQLLYGGGAVQFASPGVAQVWDECSVPDSGVLSACDPANPFGTVMPWPAMLAGCRPQRAPGARVLIRDGRLAAYLARDGKSLYAAKDAGDPGAIIGLLKQSAAGNPMFLESINGQRPYATPWHRELVAAGFSPSRRGYLLRADSA